MQQGMQKWFLLITVVAALGVTSLASAQLSITDLGTLGGGSSQAMAINARGQVVGSSETTAGERHAFLWERGTLTDLGTLGGDRSFALAINARGQVIGNSTTTGDEFHAVLWTKRHRY